ncbi:MAG TPA: hypothetical protein VHP35_18440 [Terriglobia bacterium]|nr:hypothetical protein [Terriglobia bacterium]
MDESATCSPRSPFRATSRAQERKITVEDIYQLKLWRETAPEAPEGLWYKDFGSFKICGNGRYPKTFLLRGQTAKGVRL